MANCPSIEKCPFFNDRMVGMPAMAAMMKKRYCEDNHLKCARFMVRSAKGPEAVPPDLFPNQLDRAETLIGTKGG
jgi:hypothetical protein